MLMDSSRWILVVLLLIALVGAPAMAMCGDCANTQCCCGKTGGCSKPAPPDTQRAKCCDGEAVPPRATVATADTAPTLFAGESDGTPVAPVTSPIGPHHTHDARRVDPSPVTLYTLHAAFLI